MLVDSHPLRFYIMVAASIVLALLFAVIPFPQTHQILRPELLCLLVVYWVISVPQHLGVSFAFFCGLLLDLIEHGAWGANAFALSVIAYICLCAYQRMKNYSIWHQTVWVCILVGCHQFLAGWLQGLAGYRIPTSSALATVAMTSLLWPVLLLFMRRLRRRLHLA